MGTLRDSSRHASALLEILYHKWRIVSHKMVITRSLLIDLVISRENVCSDILEGCAQYMKVFYVLNSQFPSDLRS